MTFEIRENDGHKYFGPRTWGCKQMIPTPYGLTCHYCGEGFVKSDFGLINYALLEGSYVASTANHAECMRRVIIGSAGHVLELCHCHGGALEDPPELTTRKAAQLASDLVEFRQDLERGGSDHAFVIQALRKLYTIWLAREKKRS